MTRYGYLAVEGPHDLDFTGKILRHCWGFKIVETRGNMDPFWLPLIPISIKSDDDLYKPLPIPRIYQNADWSIALSCAGGCAEKLAHNLSDSFFDLKFGAMTGVGIVTDADNDLRETWERLQSHLPPSEDVPWPSESAPGRVVPGTPKTGVYIFPDNNNSGTLEKILLELAAIAYPDLHGWAAQSLATLDAEKILDRLSSEERKLFDKPCGREKAHCGLIGAVLKPGRAVQNTIRDNKWVHDAGFGNSLLREYAAFLRDLFDLPAHPLLETPVSKIDGTA